LTVGNNQPNVPVVAAPTTLLAPPPLTPTKAKANINQSKSIKYDPLTKRNETRESNQLESKYTTISTVEAL
jgi:hypothetical protein